MQTVSILGATGTIGQNCLQVIASNPDHFTVEAITANTNAEALAKVATQTGATFAAIADESQYTTLKEHTANLGIEIAAGEKAIIEAAAKPSDVLVAGIVGTAGLKPTLKAVERGAHIALANKECLVSAGELFMQTVKQHSATLIPVDSEHNAIFQILQNGESVDTITLTASGGPFREFTLEQMASVTPEQATKHPNWQMGAKISVDSATMMNKGLELIEAMHLFTLPPEKLGILVHPESIIHGLASYHDGSVLAQLSVPDMRIPLAYALGWPKRITSGAKPINLADISKLHFEAPDFNRFPALDLAFQAMQQGGSAPTILNAANEIAVAAFLAEKISFLDITSIIDETLTQINQTSIPTLDAVFEIDTQARNLATKLIKEMG